MLFLNPLAILIINFTLLTSQMIVATKSSLISLKKKNASPIVRSPFDLEDLSDVSRKEALQGKVLFYGWRHHRKFLIAFGSESWKDKSEGVSTAVLILLHLSQTLKIKTAFFWNLKRHFLSYRSETVCSTRKARKRWRTWWRPRRLRTCRSICRLISSPAINSRKTPKLGLRTLRAAFLLAPWWVPEAVDFWYPVQPVAVSPFNIYCFDATFHIPESIQHFRDDTAHYEEKIPLLPYPAALQPSFFFAGWSPWNRSFHRCQKAHELMPQPNTPRLVEKCTTTFPSSFCVTATKLEIHELGRFNLRHLPNFERRIFE